MAYRALKAGGRGKATPVHTQSHVPP
jgi:hypothetical protein